MTTPIPPSPMHHVAKAVKVTMLNGEETTVLTENEARYYERSKKSYLNDLRWTENTDLVDLERLLTLELMVFRWQQWLFAGMDYEGDLLDNEKELTANMKLYSDQITKIKESMGLNKKARDAAASEGNFSAWLMDLKARAKIFGVHRENQLQKALVLMNDLSALVGAYDRSDEEERRKLGLESEAEILTWVRTTMLPEFKALDEFFREHEQRYWVRDL